MKNAAKLAPKLKALAKTAAKKHPPGDIEPIPALDALVVGLLRYDADETAAMTAFQNVQSEFVDFNDLRVATELEVAEVLSESFAEEEAHGRATLLRVGLSNVFDKVGRLSLEPVIGLSRREIRPALRHAIGVDDQPDAIDQRIALAFAEAHVALLALDFGTLPIDPQTRDFLATKKAIDPAADESETARFCESNLKVDDCKSLFLSIRSKQ
jgi:hypothetical protein